MICFQNYRFVALAVLLFCVASWGACQKKSLTFHPSGDYTCGRQCEEPTLVCNDSRFPYPQQGLTLIGRECYGGYQRLYCYYDGYCCGSPCEADSVSNGGIILECQYDAVENKWYKYTCTGGNSCSDGSCSRQYYADESLCQQKYCEDNPSACIDSSACDLARQRCKKLGGVFSGEPLQDGCSSSCNTCGTNATKQILKVKTESCCSQGLAPEVDAMCRTDAQSGVGETYSTNANLKCADPSLSDEAAGWYAEYCSGEHDWEDESSSSAGEGESSSSGGEGESSSDEGTSAGTSEGLEGDYYPILDTIRDTLVNIRRNVENIYLCLITPSACAGLSSGQKTGDTVIVNVPSDSVKLNDISGKLTVLDTSIQNSNDRLLEGVSHGIDTLIDSMRKYLNSSGFSGDTLGDSISAVKTSIENLPGNIAHSLDSGIMAGYNGVDTLGTSYGWIQDGESLADSVLGGSGYSGLDFAGDSAMRDSLEALGYVCTDSSCCVGSECIEFDSDQSIEDSISRMVSRMADTIHQKNSDFYNDSVTNMFQEVKDSLTAFNPLGIFDSTIMSTLGATIPNSNVCPDHCSTFQVNIPFLFGTQTVTIDWGLCMGRAVFGDGNVMSFLRFIIRIIVAVTCITAVMWNATRIRR